VITLLAVTLAGCGSSSSATNLAGLCHGYASAVKRSLPPIPATAPVPPDFLTKLGDNANTECLQRAGRLGYTAAGTAPARTQLTPTHASTLIHQLTDNTLVHFTP
jgi:hypothetical protein